METTEQKTVAQVTTTQAPKGDLTKYKGDGAAVWVNKDKNGNDYLSIKIVGHNTMNVFLNIPKE